MDKNRYVLVTAARNEAAYIEKVVQSVVAQTVLPQKWVIVSDGSTDGTDKIIFKYAKKNDYIDLLHLEPSEERNFGSKVRAIYIGLKRLKEVKFEYLGILDADITFNPDYYERILGHFMENERLGIAGGHILDVVKAKPTKNISSLDSVGGPIQMFRYKCWEEIGGYLPLKIGGEDATAEIMARMQKWEVRTFLEIEVLHHRPTGTGMWNSWGVHFYYGVENFTLGYHPLFFLAKVLYRIRLKPYLLGSIVMLCGYFWCYLSGKEREIPSDAIRYLRKEQTQKLKKKYDGLINKLFS